MEMTFSDQKNQVRKEVLLKRFSINSEAKSIYDKRMCQQLINYVESHSIKSIHSFLPIQSEVNILPFLEWALENKRIVVCPKTEEKGQMTHLKLNSLNELESGLFGTQHPSGNGVYSLDYDLIIVPVVGLTKKKYRLGYGGCYYDRFLEQHLYSTFLTVVYPFQLDLSFPVEDHDAKMDILISGRL